MKPWLAKFRFAATHQFTRDVATLQAASVAARVISLGSSFVFAKVLGPEQYGFYALVIALGGMINIFQDFGVGQGTVNLLARARAGGDTDEGRRLVKFFTLVSIFVLLTTGLIGFLIAPYLGERFYNNRYLGSLAAITVAGTALTFFYPLSTITLQVARKIRTLAILETTNKILNSLIPLALILLGFGVAGIISGQFATVIVISIPAAVLYQRLAREEPFFPGIKRLFSVHLSWQKIKSYLRFSLEIALSKNLMKLNVTLPILLVGYFLPTTSGLAFYKIAFAFVSLPLLFLDPVSKLLNVQLPQTERAGMQKLFRRFFQVSAVSVGIAAVITAVMALLAKPLITTFFEEYKPSIPLIYGLAFYPLLMASGVALGAMFRTVNKMRAAIWIQLVTTVLLVPSAYFLISNYAIKGLIAVVLIFTFVPNLLSFVYFLISPHARKSLQ